MHAVSYLASFQLYQKDQWQQMPQISTRTGLGVDTMQWCHSESRLGGSSFIASFAIVTGLVNTVTDKRHKSANCNGHIVWDRLAMTSW